ncbi:hypothetical protein C2I18_21610 [Paenibacillus sp. PK3_47]|uniref:hypothetical protein n=1 Tax=Paenibacillus sp. PK3_47 TaxID=2072642 RepID=UPI00201DF670|nr:hypothetical protein [Paenibacillus sp. PK3_47]UQZ35903.1 hypothetical protein C2I18_21610 [Paenibacillus sp. PK3_47]
MQAILQVGFIVAIHIFFIFLLDLKKGIWEQETLKQAFLIYSVLAFLLYISCRMSLVTRKPSYNVLWFCVSTIPSTGFLFLLFKNTGDDAAEFGFVDMKFDSGVIELVVIFPFIFFIVQFLLIIALWVLKIPEDKG